MPFCFITYKSYKFLKKMSGVLAHPVHLKECQDADQQLTLCSHFSQMAPLAPVYYQLTH